MIHTIGSHTYDHKNLKKLDDVEEENQKMMTLSYDDGKSFIALNKLGDDLYTIEDDEGEVLLSADHIDFIMYAYNRIKDKPCVWCNPITSSHKKCDNCKIL